MLKYFNIDSSQWWKVLEHGLFVGAGTLLTYLTTAVAGMSFGPLTPVLVAVLTLLSSYVHKVVTNDPSSNS